MGGRGGSSGLSGGSSAYDRNGLLKNTTEYSGYDANKLSGTQKQKEYAQNIINDGFRNIKEQIERIRREKGKLIESYPYRADSIRINANAAIQSYIDIKRVFVTSFNGKMNDAGKVIANKDKIKDALSPLRESLEVKYQKQYMDEYKKKHGNK